MRSFCAFVAILGLAIEVVIGQYYPRNTGFGNATFSFKSTSESLTTSYSSITGPYAEAYTFSWSQWLSPTTVGTVMVTVNEANNKTWSTTVYHTELSNNGTMSILTRTDVNSAGTVTTVVTDMHSSSITITYPIGYLEVGEKMTWDGIFATAGINGSCCAPSETLSPTPAHASFAQTGDVNSRDPQGWLYTLVGPNDEDPHTRLAPSIVSSLWTGQSLNIPYSGCPFTACGLWASVAAASAVASQAFLLATSTTTISSADMAATSATKSAQPVPNKLSPPPTPTSSASKTTAQDISPLQDIQPPTNTHPPQNTVPLQNPSPPSKSPDSVASQNPGSQDTISEQTSIKSPISSALHSIPPQVPQAGSNPTSVAAPISDNSAITPSTSSNYIIEGQTLLPGSSITIGSSSLATVVAMQISNSQTIIVVGSSTSTLGQSAAPIPTPVRFTIGSSAITADSATKYVIAGQTLQPGSSITIGSGNSVTVVAMQTSNSQTIIIAGSSTITLSQNESPIITPPPFTIGASVITANSASEYVINAQTLSPGSAIVVSGTTISLAPGATELIYGTRTEIPATTTTGIGGIIWSMFGGSTTSSSPTLSAGAPSAGSSNSSGVTPPTFQGGSQQVWPSWELTVFVFSLLLVAS